MTLITQGKDVGIPAAQKEQWLHELCLNGFVVFRNFLPLDLIEAMYEQIQPLYRGKLARVQAGDTSTLRGPNRMSFDLRPYIARLKGPLDDDRFRRNPVVEEIVSTVLVRWRYGVTKAECPYKNSNMMSWHPDSPSSGDPAGPVIISRLTFNVPLVDVHDSNGPMEVLPGSHRMHHHDLHLYINSLPNLYPARLLLRRGDALLRHGNLLHRGTPNVTEEPRILLDQTYRSLDDPSSPVDSNRQAMT